MGGEVSKKQFSAKDHERFQQRLGLEMDFVRKLFGEKRFDRETRRLGYELELCLLEPGGLPAPVNQQVLDFANNDLFTHELAKYNLEINGNTFDLNDRVFSAIENDLTTLYASLEQAAANSGAKVGLFGVLPSLGQDHLDGDRFMSGQRRYRVLDRCLMEMRQRPVQLDIRGNDHLQMEKNDVMFEALGTSLQTHMQIPFDEAVNSYHAALWASMAVVAVSANSPLVLNKRCWHESRIAIFKQAVDTRNTQEVNDEIIPRVHFGKGYIQSMLDLFEDNSYYSPILPEVRETEIEALFHFNLHNGTIWRWIRPIIGRIGDTHHLRLELRVTPSGPTLIDTVANLVFYVGLIEGLKTTPDVLTRIPFEQLEKDFYRVAREGLAARVRWCEGDIDSIQNLLLNYAIPTAARGLNHLGIIDSGKWLDIIQQRVVSGQTGADWILQYWQQSQDVCALVCSYIQNAEQNIPVHLWPRP